MWQMFSQTYDILHMWSAGTSLRNEVVTLNDTFSFEPTATDPRGWVEKELLQATNHGESIVWIANHTRRTGLIFLCTHVFHLREQHWEE